MLPLVALYALLPFVYAVPTDAVTDAATESSAAAVYTAYSTRMADSAIARAQGNGLTTVDGTLIPRVSYETATLQNAMYELIQSKKLSNAQTTKYWNYITTATDRVVAVNGSLIGILAGEEYALDTIKLGETFIRLHQRTNNIKYKFAADWLRGQIATGPRTPAGALWHKLKYPNQQWLDGIYMALPFYALYTATYDKNSQASWNDILNQLTLIHDHTVIYSGQFAGLMYHGYDASHVAVWSNNTRGSSPESWDRALGWWTVALVDLLKYVPANQKKLISTIESYAKEIAPALARNTDASSGVWWMVMTQPGRLHNYLESSATAMFVNFYLKAIRLKLIDSKTYLPVAKRAYTYMVKNWVQPASDGTLNFLQVDSVAGLSGNGTFDYYISKAISENDLKGTSPFIMASIELESL